MNISKLLEIFFVILLVITFTIACDVNNNEKKENINKDINNWPADGLYFMKWDSYHAYFEEEEPYIQLSAIQIHSAKQKNEQSYKKYILLSNKGEITATFTNYLPGPKEEKYSLYTIGLRLPKMKPGKYIISKLKIIDSNNQQKMYDIGKWVIDIKKGFKPKDLDLGKKTFISGYFDWYRVEILNNTREKIHIENLDFQLNTPVKTIIKIGKDFNMTEYLEEEPYIDQGETKVFQFEFVSKVNDSKPKFISLRPVLYYKINNQSKFIILPTAIYSPVVNDKTILELVQSLNQ
ncbi:hypothetical protein SAMN02745135_01268 [Caloranaerobacter azorensis DSM 13643]|uniref:Lipoprotein n=1 Tax=Caloranaerobacter azorensis DSM 13643 TaxID=1121264 RepID=A0A1M5U5J0_9FIRM|nr:hypothetical protein [Caloranaerobacter azorensis]SHH57973.1 hypothetical protein SAMN02745135_01268 [Caloranaerobacter azorensis DSM 13643]